MIKNCLLFFLIFIVGLTPRAKAQNVLISTSSNPNEPSIKIDPVHPERLVAATNLDNYYVSADTGHTWTHEHLSSSYGVWGDPVIDVDTSGHFYFFHLSNPSDGNWIDRIVCQKSTDNGEVWSDGTFTGLNGNKAQDKHWSIVDRTNNHIYLTWTQFDVYGSTNPADSSIILFSKSLDGGDSWSAPLRINKVAGDCIDSDDTVEGAVPAVGPNGEIYVTWAGPTGLVFNRSTDQGETWLETEILISTLPGGWDFGVPGIYRSNGLPITKCDLSGGPNHGTIYVNWSDQRNGGNDTDIWLSKSTDGGDTWSAPIRVNDDEPGHQQFFTWMDIDQTNGNLFFVFYDRRNYMDTQTDVSLAWSTDGGNSFTNKIISESPFIPNEGVFFGDYTNLTVHDNIVRPIWTRLHEGQLSVWTDVTPFQHVVNAVREPSSGNLNEFSQFPNPTSDMAYISFKLHDARVVNLKLFDGNGRQVAVLLQNESLGYGKHIIPVDLKTLKLQSGLYYPQLTIDGKVKTLKMLMVE
ncbi:MAG: T9SS type A sorting domain-containing protein [Lewinellaceae bacterium]|nr:T9SS type A sorting domain-containing protein [Lewinellaceae bacterium]